MEGVETIGCYWNLLGSFGICWFYIVVPWDSAENGKTWQTSGSNYESVDHYSDINQTFNIQMIAILHIFVESHSMNLCWTCKSNIFVWTEIIALQDASQLPQISDSFMPCPTSHWHQSAKNMQTNKSTSLHQLDATRPETIRNMSVLPILPSSNVAKEWLL